MTFDAHADNSAIRETGFDFRYPSPREGLPPTLEALGALAAVSLRAGIATDSACKLPF